MENVLSLSRYVFFSFDFPKNVSVKIFVFWKALIAELIGQFSQKWRLFSISTKVLWFCSSVSYQIWTEPDTGRSVLDLVRRACAAMTLLLRGGCQAFQFHLRASERAHGRKPRMFFFFMGEYFEFDHMQWLHYTCYTCKTATASGARSQVHP